MDRCSFQSDVTGRRTGEKSEMIAKNSQEKFRRRFIDVLREPLPFSVMT